MPRVANAKRRKNPRGLPAGEYGRNGTKIGARVYALEYRHAVDGENYRHDFGGGVEMIGQPDGSVLLRHPSRRLWEDHLVTDR